MTPSSATALQSLNDFSGTRRSATDITNDANSQYDIPGYTTRLSKLRGLVGNLTSSIDSVDPSVTGRTSGSFVTEGQRQALVNKERAPLLTNLGTEQNALGQEQTGYNTALTSANSLASAMMSQDQNKYQSLLDQYNAATAAEKDAESKRQFDATMAENARQFNSTPHGSAANPGIDLSSIIGALSGGSSTTSQTPAEIAYQNVQGFLAKGSAAANSDYAATLKSANNGNALDKLKIQAYNKAGIYGPTSASAFSTPSSAVAVKAAAPQTLNIKSLR